MNKQSTFSASSIRLWQLISPALPVGAYAYSQGLEYAVDSEWITDEQSASDWILGQLGHNLSQLDVPVYIRMYEAWAAEDLSKVNQLNQLLLALRESAELKQQDVNHGNALIKVLQGLDIEMPELEHHQLSFICVFAFACQYWSINKLEGVHGLLWSWCENQVAAAIKIIPLGQTAGQRLMSAAIETITDSIEKGLQCEDDDIGILAPGVAIASALHETQYSRLFRS